MVLGQGTPRRKSVSLLVADGEWDAKSLLTPRRFRGGWGKATGSGVSMEWVLPVERTKQAGCGRGELQTKQVGRGRDAELRKIPYDIVIKMCHSAEVL